jgi:hypothetical protein
MTQYIPLRVRARLALKKVLPTSLFNHISTIWQKTGARLFDVQGAVDKYTKQFVSKNPKIVQGGPFAGMRYVDEAVGSNYLHKLVGSYEAVLHPFIASLQGKKFDTIVDIGSAEGYYLIGLGRLFNDVTLIGYELEEKGRALTLEMAKINNIKNKLVLEGEATVTNVASVITPDTLLICDCEGAELDILNPTIEPNIANFDTAIIELHDFIRPGIKEALTERFSKTHTITIVPFVMADYSQYPFFNSITNQDERYEILRERGWQEQEWMILVRK